MNQILITEKLYITPELKRKKRMYKFDFILSVFLAIVLISCGIYAEYDRNKSEESSQDILQSANSTLEEQLEKAEKNKVLIAVLNSNQKNTLESLEDTSTSSDETSSTDYSQEVQYANGFEYTIDAIIYIPKLGITYPILKGTTGSEEETEALLKVSPCKFWGPEPNQKGNYSIVGHNYRNTKFFSKVPTLSIGDTIELTDMTSRRTIVYTIYNKYTVVPEDVSCIDQPEDERKEVTLITCTDDSKKRVIIKAKA